MVGSLLRAILNSKKQSKNLQIAYEHGKSIGKLGGAQTLNPYTKGSRCYLRWIEGYEDEAKNDF